MKKFVSTLTSLCMSVSLTAGTLAAFSASAADISNVPVQKTLKLLADGKSNYTISAEDIAKGDVQIEVGVYLDETEANTGTITAKMGLSEGPDMNAVSITDMGDIYKNTVDAFDYTFKGGANDGITIKSTKRLAFYGTYKKATKKVANVGSILASNVFDDGSANFIYSAGADTPKWLGAKSDEFPVNVFTVTVKKGAAAGDYKVDFVNKAEDAGNGAQRNATQLGFWDVSIKNPLDNLLVGGLGLEGLTITVEGDKETTTTTTTTDKPATATTVTTVSDKPITTVTTDSSVDPLPEGLVWKVDDVKLTREELVENDGLVVVPVRVAQVSDQMIAGAAFTFKLADELTWEGEEIDPTNEAYDNCVNTLNKTEPKVNFSCPQPNPDGGRDIGFVCKDEGAVIINLVVSLPTDVADGKYDIDMIFDGVDRAVADNSNTTAKVSLVGGSVTIGDVVEPSSSTTATTATTPAPSSSSTTATTTKETPATSGTTGTVLYGDSNVDGKVNIADVVCLNQYLVDNAKYDLSAQGKINAEVNLDGKLTAADSTSIIKSLVKLVTLPDKA